MKTYSLILVLIAAIIPNVIGCAHVDKRTKPIVYHGKASYYGDWHQGKITANGEVFNKNKLTCAHKKLPFETICRVTNNSNGRSVIVRVNDGAIYTGADSGSLIQSDEGFRGSQRWRNRRPG